MGNKQAPASRNAQQHFELVIAGYVRENTKLFIPKSIHLLFISFYNALNFNTSIILKDGNKINLPKSIMKINKNIRISCDKWIHTAKQNNSAQSAAGIIHIICHSFYNNGIIDASGSGWYGSYGKGSGIYFETKSRLPDMSGGSYGTLSGSCGDIYSMDSSLYGNTELSEVYYGSGIAPFNDRSGGGIIIIECSNYFENNGEIKANGDSGCSGGSILIICKTFNNKKSGSIRANGGDGMIESKEFFCSGGDGRIAIYSHNYFNSRSTVEDGGIYFSPKPYFGKYKDASFTIMMQ